MTLRNVHGTLLPKTGRDRSLQQPQLQENQIKEKQKLSQQLKQKYIQDLQERNRKLRKQIQKITEILDQNQEKQKDKEKNVKKQYKSTIGHTPQENNPQVLKKQLENVYKQIKNYQRQIQKVQNNRSGSRIYSDQISRLQVVKYQKLSHLEKLKNQLSGLGSQQVVNSKKLKNNLGRQYYENLIIKLGDQLKILREKLRAAEEKQRKKGANAKKQLQYIKKLERQLVQSGVPMDQMEELKKKNVYMQVKSIMNGERQADRPVQVTIPINGQAEEDLQQIITFQKLEQMKNQGKLYKKLHLDYEKRINSILKQKQSADKLIIQKQNLIKDKSQQIQKLNQQINEVKQLVRKNNVQMGTIAGGQIDSIRKNQRKKSIQSNQQRSNSKEGNQSRERESFGKLDRKRSIIEK